MSQGLQSRMTHLRGCWFEGSSGGLRRGIKLVLLAGNTSYGLQLVLGSAIFTDVVAELRRKGSNSSQSKNLLRCEGNATKRSTGEERDESFLSPWRV